MPREVVVTSRASILLSIACLCLYLALPQRVPHGLDTHYFIGWIESGSLSYPRHLLYLPLVAALHAVLGPLGLSTYGCLLVASALGSAVGVAFLHRAALRLLPARSPATPGPAAWVALSCATAPSVFYFATAGEIPGVFCGFVGMCWWLYSRWFVRRTAVAAAWLGAATGSSAMVHATGHLLVPLLLIAHFWLADRSPRTWWRQALALVGMHAAVSATLGLVAGSVSRDPFADAFGLLEVLWENAADGSIWLILWREWFLAYMPWSVLVLAGLLRGPGRRWFAVSLSGFVVYLPLVIVLLLAGDVNEVGAYHLPLVFPLVCFAALRLPTWSLAAAAAGGLAVGIHEASGNWELELDPGFVEGVAELHRSESFLLVCNDRQQTDAVRTLASEVPCIEISRALSDFALQPDTGLDALKRWFDAWVRRMRGQDMRILFAKDAMDRLASTDVFDLDRLYREHVTASYELRPVERAGFRGVWVDPK